MQSIYDQLPRTFNVAAHFLEDQYRAGKADAPAYLYRDGQLTYEQVRTEVCRMAAQLQEWNVEWESRIALLLPDCPELVIAFWGGIWAGVVPVPINTAYQEDDISYILEDCRAKVLVTTREWGERLSSHSLLFLKRVVIVDGTPSLRGLLSQQTNVPPAAATCKDDSAFWLYTSGSTGKPKGVIHLHHDMVVCAQRYAKDTIGLRMQDLIYSIAKIPFAYGHGNTLYFPLAVGASAVLSDARNAFEVIADLERYRPTVFFGIPSVYKGILDVQEIAPYTPSSLRLCLSAAESLPPSIWYRWRDQFGLEICEGIGTTELLHIFLSNRPGEVKPGSTGRVVAGYSVRVVDSEGNSVPTGEVGDLIVGGESLMAGYWNRHRETTQALFGEEMRTGDKYVVDADGYHYFVGRADDRFKVNGQWIIPVEVEDVLLQFPGVSDAAVVSETQEGEGLPSLVAYLALKTGSVTPSQLIQELKQHCRRALPAYKVPRRMVIVDAIARTATGKIDRKHLRVGREG